MNSSSSRAATEERLTGLLAEFAQVVGREAALKIAAVVGGTRIYLPARADDDHWLVRAIGRELADKLTQHFAVFDGRTHGQRLDLPLGPTSGHLKWKRHVAAAIHAMTEDGASTREIALELGVSQRTVYLHRRRYRQERGQA